MEVKGYKTLILDIRGNGGGNSDCWHGLIVPQLINNPVIYNTYLLYRGGEYEATEKVLSRSYI